MDGSAFLLADLAEAGVRFIEVNHGSWDQHKNHRRDLKANCDATDGPVAALLEDLDQRGLLEDTLIVWGGEFGRPGLTPEDGKDATGHNANGFTFLDGRRRREVRPDLWED